MAQADLYTGINAKLVASTGGGTFYADVTGRIYQDFAPANATLPFAVVSVLSDPQLLTFDNNHMNATIECQVWGDAASGPHAVRAINDKLVALLHKQTITVSGFSNVAMVATDIGSAERIEDAILVTTLYEIAGSD